MVKNLTFSLILGIFTFLVPTPWMTGHLLCFLRLFIQFSLDTFIITELILEKNNFGDVTLKPLCIAEERFVKNEFDADLRETEIADNISCENTWFLPCLKTEIGGWVFRGVEL